MFLSVSLTTKYDNISSAKKVLQGGYWGSKKKTVKKVDLWGG
jgi:hypothetical protein